MKLFPRFFSTPRSATFKKMFTEEERIAIINALYRRSADLSTSGIIGDKRLRDVCKDIANEMMK